MGSSGADAPTKTSKASAPQVLEYMPDNIISVPKDIYEHFIPKKLFLFSFLCFNNRSNSHLLVQALQHRLFTQIGPTFR